MKKKTKFIELKELFKTLHGPKGCLWDKKQTHKSLLPYLREEVEEFIAEVKKCDYSHMQEELGDIMIQVMFHSQIASKEGMFDVEDVIDTLIKKLKRRHPHVFGKTKVKSTHEIIRNWNKIKKQEKKSKNLKLAALVLIGLFLLQGCAVVRSPGIVPDALIYEARVAGAPNVRTVVDYLDSDSIRTQFNKIEYQLSKDIMSRRDIYILAISGGGANGAYSAGILCGWTEKGTRPQFDVVTGVSTGALIGPFAFLGPEYDQILKKIYTTTSDKDIFRKIGIFPILFGRADSLSSTGPLAEILDNYITLDFLKKVAFEHAKGRRLFVATTNLDAQRPVIWNMGMIASIGTPEALTLFRKVLMASAAIPVVFPPVHIAVEVDGVKYDEMHVDGGVSTQVFGYFFTPGKEITSHIYVIRNNKLVNEPKEVQLEISSIASQSLSMLTTIQGVNDLIRIHKFAQDDFDDYNATYIPQGFSCPRKGNFDPVYMNKLFELGYQKAKSLDFWEKQPPELNFHEIHEPAK